MTTTKIDNDDFENDEQANEASPSETPSAPAAPHNTKKNRSASEKNRSFRSIENQETFGYQPTATKDLPAPGPWVEMMVSGVLESIHGARDARQFIRWMTDDVYQAVEARAKSVRLRHQALKKPIARPVFTLGNVIVSSPRDGVVEAAAVVHGPTRVRAVAIRLEGLDRRWMTTSFRML